MRENHTLERYAILKLVRDHSNLTRYKARLLLRKLNLSMPISTFYTLINQLEKDDFISRRTETYKYKRMSKTFDRDLFDLTTTGHKLLIDLEFRIRVVLAGSSYGEKV